MCSKSHLWNLLNALLLKEQNINNKVRRAQDLSYNGQQKHYFTRTIQGNPQICPNRWHHLRFPQNPVLLYCIFFLSFGVCDQYTTAYWTAYYTFTSSAHTPMHLCTNTLALKFQTISLSPAPNSPSSPFTLLWHLPSPPLLQNLCSPTKGKEWRYPPIIILLAPHSFTPFPFLPSHSYVLTS